MKIHTENSRDYNPQTDNATASTTDASGGVQNPSGVPWTPGPHDRPAAGLVHVVTEHGTHEWAFPNEWDRAGEGE